MNFLLLSIVRYILCLKVNFSTTYLEILSLLDFFANKGQFTPRGRGQSYKIWGKSASVHLFAKIAKLSQNNDFGDQSHLIFFANLGRLPLKAGAHTTKFGVNRF
jgi:hypothetical protein